jgi:hypothetical protein
VQVVLDDAALDLVVGLGDAEVELKSLPIDEAYGTPQLIRSLSAVSSWIGLARPGCWR